MAHSGDTTTLERQSESGVQLKSASALAFAPNGVLLVGDGLGGRGLRLRDRRRDARRGDGPSRSRT